jgi:hypothetical protein
MNNLKDYVYSCLIDEVFRSAIVMLQNEETSLVKEKDAKISCSIVPTGLIL